MGNCVVEAHDLDPEREAVTGGLPVWARPDSESVGSDLVLEPDLFRISRSRLPGESKHAFVRGTNAVDIRDGVGDKGEFELPEIVL